MMNTLNQDRSIWMWAAALGGVLFGVLTIISGGSVLFDPAARQAAGDYVAFVVWFNFLAGFVYIIAGAGLWLFRRWAAWLAGAIAGTTLLVLGVFAVYIWSGGAYEVRTLVALILRIVVWAGISAVAYQSLN